MTASFPIKYRPRLFSNVVGQTSAIAILRARLKRSWPEATVVYGPSAVGKTTIARILGRRLNCEKPNGHEPCLKCASCQETEHPDILEVNAAADRGIDTIRFLGDQAELAPRYKTRVFVLDECHAITASGYQAFLKSLEEPPPSTKFILLTTEPEALPRTILSRCVHLRLNAVSVPDIGIALKRVAKRLKVELSQADVDAVAEAAGGRVRDALHLLEQVLALKDEDPAPVEALVPRLTGDNFNRMWQVLKAIEAEDLREAVSLSLEIDRFVELLPVVLNYVITDRIVRKSARCLNKARAQDLQQALTMSLEHVQLVRYGAPATAVRTSALLTLSRLLKRRPQ
jgi:DNA polymerase III subunit gamma/tau